MPHRDPVAAAEFIAGSGVLPYLPQLPGRHPAEGMLLQWGDGLCGCGGSDGALHYGGEVGERWEAFGGSTAMLDLLAAETPQLKVQATGPITLAAAMRAGGRPVDGLWKCVAAGLVARVEDHLDMIRSRLPDAEILLMYDEPALAALPVDGGDSDSQRALEVLSEVMDRTPVAAGIHCCGDTDWAGVAALEPAAVSLDAASLGIAFAVGIEQLARAVSAGTRMIWGAVPTDVFPLPDTEELVARVRRAEGALVMAGADMRRLADAWVTPACGMAGLTEEQAAVVVGRLHDVAGDLDG